MKKLLLLNLLILVCNTALPATTLYYNADVIPDFKTPENRFKWLLVQDGKVQLLGSGNKPEADLSVDLQGMNVIPALTDSHAHVTELGKSFYEIDLKGTRSEIEAIKRVKEFIKKNSLSPNTTITGAGWDQSDWPLKNYPSRTSLDTISQTQAIILYRVDGHAAWTNTFALKKTSFWKNVKDPSGGKVLREKTGLPAGVLVDKAIHALDPFLKESSKDDLEKYILKATEHSLSLGITGIHDAGASKREIETIRSLLKNKRLRFRFYEMVGGADKESLTYYLRKGPEIDSFDGMLNVRSVKLFKDGAMGSRGALFTEPYDDDPTNHGLSLLSEKEMTTQIKKIDKAGFQIAIHAIGSLANHLALNTFAKVLGKNTASKRPRLEHAQVLSESDIMRLKPMGVISSMQPTHCTSDMKWVVERIGKARARFSYAWKSILEAGAPLAFGSDAPVESLNPWPGLYSAMTRQTAEGQPEGGFNPEENISLSQALTAFSEGSAYSSFQEQNLGSLETGKWADFVVLKSDPFKLNPRQIHAMTVESTYIMGQQAWPLTDTPKLQ